MGGRKRKIRKTTYAVIGTGGILLAIYFILVNFLVSAALVPSFMQRLEAFSRITDESYAAQVQTSDIQYGSQKQDTENDLRDFFLLWSFRWIWVHRLSFPLCRLLLF